LGHIDDKNKDFSKVIKALCTNQSTSNTKPRQ